jgi:hypothetical protein
MYDRNKAVWLNNVPKKNRKIILDTTREKLEKNHFIVIEDVKYYERLYASGSDVPSIERADLLELYSDVKCDYILLIELLNSQGGNFAGGFGYKSAAHVKLLDTHSSKYLYNSGVYESTTWGSARAPIRKIGERIATLIDEKLIAL